MSRQRTAIIALAFLAATCRPAAAADGSVGLRIVDRLGNAIPAVFSVTDAAGKTIAGPVEAGQTVRVPPGSWIIVPESNPRLAKPISVGDGQVLSVDIEQPNGIWLSFVGGGAGSSQWLLMEPKDPAAIAAALAAFDLSRGDNDLLAAGLLGVLPEAAAAALALARAEYGKPIADHSASGEMRWRMAQRWAARILAAIGDATDLERLTRPEALLGDYSDLQVAAHIEQRLGRIERGRLVAIADGGPSSRSVAAAVLLHQAGVAHGDERLSDLLARPTGVWYQAWLAAVPVRSARMDAAFAAQAGRFLKRAAEIAGSRRMSGRQPTTSTLRRCCLW